MRLKPPLTGGEKSAWPGAYNTHVNRSQPPQLITTPAQVQALAETLSAEPLIAVDTESNSMYAYHEQVCLLQFSTPTLDALVDPLAVPDLSALAGLFANPAQEKIFHAAEYDVLCLKRDFGWTFVNLFDTMVAARTLGWPQVGLGALLEKQFDVRLEKKYQRANWGERPLPPELLDYARLDTHYLIPLRHRLHAELSAAGYLPEAQDEFDRLARLPGLPPRSAPGPDDFWQVSGARDLPADRAPILRELFFYRDAQAAQLNRPPFRVMGDDTLCAIAAQAPLTLQKLATLPGMTESQVRRHGRAILHAVRAGLEQPPLKPPRPVFEPDAVRDRIDRLKQWRKTLAQKRGVESDVILPREALWELARTPPASLADLERIAALGPHRREKYGPEILRLLNR